MRLLIFITPREFRDESLATVKLFFDKWGVEYRLTSYSHSDCVGTHGATYKLDLHANNVNIEDYNGIVLIDGKGVEIYKLYDYRPLLDMLLKFNDRRKAIIAINNSIKVPTRANIIKGRKISTPDDEEIKRLVMLFHGIPTSDGMEIADNLITVRESSALEGNMPTILDRIGVS